MRIITVLQIGSALCGLAVASPAIARSDKFQTIYSFGSVSNDGSNPRASLISAKGVLYGTTYNGGNASGEGTVYAIDPGTGQETIVTAGMGAGPLTPVIFYKHSLFGTSSGASNIFSVDIITKQVTSLYTFPDGGDDEPAYPNGLTEFGGKLYGSTYDGGNRGCGYVFDFDPATDRFSRLHTFTCGVDGAYPEGDLVLHKDLLYGVTMQGGPDDSGTIFSVDPASGKRVTLYSLKETSDGSFPNGIAFQKNVIYGAVTNGGMSGNGSLFSFDPTARKYTTLFAFPSGAGGCHPFGAPVRYKDRLYGVTSGCSNPETYGNLYEVSLKTGEEKILHSFSNGLDGGTPFTGLLLYQGALYGTTIYGGTDNSGTVFKYVP